MLRCYTLHFKGEKYLQSILKYHAVIILLHAHVVGLEYTLLVCWFFLSVVCSCSLEVTDCEITERDIIVQQSEDIMLVVKLKTVGVTDLFLYKT